VPFPELAQAFVAGMASSAHCLGMCGPVAALAGRASSRAGPTLFLLGKTGSYLFLGASLGAGGALAASLATPRLLMALRQVAGVVFLLVAFELAFPGRLPRARLPGLSVVGARLGGLARTAGGGAALALGTVAGLAPCGFSWGMAAWAAGTGDPLRGAALMVAFGAGTAPALLVAGHLAGASGPGARAGMRILGAISWAVVGAMLVLG
jgi:sulfite exporter TauE/SafE